MKKTIHKNKLQLSKQTVRQLSSADLVNAQGAIQNTAGCGSNRVTCYTCSCKQSVCNSCFDTDCCLMTTTE